MTVLVDSAADAPVLAPSVARWRAVRGFRCWLTVYRRTWRSSIWSGVLGPVFYLAAMGFGLGSLVDKHGASAALGGLSYLAFVAPAILASQSMMTAVGESSFPVFGSIKWNRIYIAAQATPLRPADIYRGHLLFMLMRIAMNSVIYLIVMTCFGAARSWLVIFALPVAVLTGLAFAAPIAAWAVTLKVETSFNYLFRFFMVPLMMFSGTFYPVSRLPGWLHPVVYASPLWQSVDLCRSLSSGSVVVGTALGHVAYLGAAAGLGIWAGGRTYLRRLYV
jgi:lipooligosaccharide transport system permease protein